MKKFILLTAILSSMVIYADGETHVESVQLEKEETVVKEVIFKENNWVLGSRFGGNFFSNYEWDVDDRGENDDSDFIEDVYSGDGDGLGWEVALEGGRKITDNFTLGLGLAFQKHSEGGDFNEINPLSNKKWWGKSSSFESIPLYAFGKYSLKEFAGVKPYIKGDFGYSYNYGENDVTYYLNDSYTDKVEIDNGVYWGVGLGAEYKNFFTDIMYKVNTGNGFEMFEERVEGEPWLTGSDVDYSRVTLGFGYNFEF